MIIDSLDLPQLETFKTGEGSFYSVGSLTIESILISIDWLDLPNLKKLVIGRDSFYKVSTLTLSSNVHC